MSLHSEIIEIVCKKHDAETHGFRKKTREMMEEYRDKSWYVDLWDEEEVGYYPRIVPDAYMLDDENSQIYIYEVEVSHPLTDRKLRKYEDLFWLFDINYYYTHLIVYDRFMHRKDISIAHYSANVKREQEKQIN